MRNKSNSSGGLGLFSVLTIIFIVLKLTDVINWSWWLVLLPFYGSIIIGLTILFIIILIGSNKPRSRKQRDRN